MKKLISIFLFALAANFAWENAHAVLYANYRGGIITEWILIRATFWDAVMITALSILFIKIPYFRERRWWMLVFGILLGVGIELWALGTARWAYTSAMPRIPFLGVGLSPALQLGVLGYAVLLIVLRKQNAQAEA